MKKGPGTKVCLDCGGEKKTKESRFCYKCRTSNRPSGLNYVIKVVNKGWIKTGDKRNVGIKRSEEYKQKMSERFKGLRRSPDTEFKYKNGKGYRWLLKSGKLNQICSSCGETKLSRLQVHHIDKDRNNNDINNFRVLCRPCHLAEHGRVERAYVEGRNVVNFL